MFATIGANMSKDGLEARTPRGGSSEVAERALDVLLCFLDAEGELGVSEIARRLDIDKGRVHRFLTALKRKGLVTDNPRTRRYSLGFRVLELYTALTRQLDVVSQAQPFIRELRDATSETGGLTVRVADHRVHVAQAESQHEIRQSFPIGKPLPLHTSASGRVLLAFQPPAEIERLLSRPLERLTESTITDPNLLRREMDLVRQRGYAVSSGERMVGSRSVAAPVWSWRGDVMALVVSGPAFRFTAEKASEAVAILLEVAARYTRQLGGEPFVLGTGIGESESRDESREGRELSAGS